MSNYHVPTDAEAESSARASLRVDENHRDEGHDENQDQDQPSPSLTNQSPTTLSSLAPDVFVSNGNFDTGPSRARHSRAPSRGTTQRALSQLHQNQYNANRRLLGQAITAVLKLLKDLQEHNRNAPIYYPPVLGIEGHTNGNKSNGNSTDGINGNDSKDHKGKGKARLDQPMDSETLEPLPEPLPPSEPRLLLAHAHELNVFKLDLKIGGLSGAGVVDSLDTSSVAPLFESLLVQIMRHLTALRERLDDTSSKVLITGDLNAGKSTFSNALLRRRLLPTDQQPCTNVFCEVRDCVDNDGLEEVHAVLLNRVYDRTDSATYEVHSLDNLDSLVYESEKFSILKIYVHDTRPVTRSLLRNGVVDISLIDAPGLNKDSLQTTQIFSRQEEIDLVVFVVSAENHFTLSAQEFIRAAAHEKSFIFIVVNRFDSIRDKDRCRRRILDQVAELSPETHKDARDFVHFVSSGEVVDGLPGGGDGPDNDPDNDPDLDPDVDPDFDRLEESLRDFVLEKRSLSKLLPAKTYLANILRDMETLSEVNVRFSERQQHTYLSQLNDLSPQVDAALNESARVNDQIQRQIEALTTDVYESTRAELEDSLTTPDTAPAKTLTLASVMDLGAYAQRLHAQIVDTVQCRVHECEAKARSRTAAMIGSINQLGILHLGEQPVFNKLFREEVMFSRKRDHLARSLRAELTVSDFFDLALPVWIGSSSPDPAAEKSLTVSTVNNALTLASVVGGGQLLRSTHLLRTVLDTVGVVDLATVRRLAVPLLVALAGYGLYYLVTDIPRALPKNIRAKVKREVDAMDYIHANATRIARECNTVLQIPANDVRAAFQSSVEAQSRAKDALARKVRDADSGLQFFSRMVQEAAKQRLVVDGCQLES